MEAGTDSWNFKNVPTISLDSESQFIKVLRDIRKLRIIKDEGSEEERKNPVISIFDIEKGYITWKECE